MLSDALKRAQSVREAQSPPHPLDAQQETSMVTSRSAFHTPPHMDADKARKEWRKHGEGLSQVSEEKRRAQSSADTVVRIIAAEERSDVGGSTLTAYVISVMRPGTSTPILIEHRYSDFDRLHSILRKHNIKLAVSFPSKSWAGRMGNWTPSLSLAPARHHDLVSYRKVQLDLWLVDLVEAYNRGRLENVMYQEVHEFLSDTTRKPPCDRENDIDLNTPVERSLRRSNPLSFTLGSSIRQAAYTVQYMCGQGLSESDQSIPLDLIQQAQGLCFLTVMKAGLVVSGKLGTGVVIARKGDGSWSAPSALGTVGVGWGAQIGGDITHYLIVLTSKDAVDALSASSSVTFGAELGVAVGPVGRGATSHISSSAILQPAYAYAHSQGLFAGISLEGSIVNARHDLNTKFYGRNMEVREILTYRDPPTAAKPLYDALNKALQQEIPADGLRPSTLFNSSCSPENTPLKPQATSSTLSTTISDSPRMQSPTMGYETPVHHSHTASPVTIDNINQGQSSLFDTPHKYRR
jgi:lipid-binding SYLF domain-containing protein